MVTVGSMVLFSHPIVSGLNYSGEALRQSVSVVEESWRTCPHHGTTVLDLGLKQLFY